MATTSEPSELTARVGVASQASPRAKDACQSWAPVLNSIARTVPGAVATKARPSRIVQCDAPPSCTGVPPARSAASGGPDARVTLGSGVGEPVGGPPHPATRTATIDTAATSSAEPGRPVAHMG